MKQHLQRKTNCIECWFLHRDLWSVCTNLNNIQSYKLSQVKYSKFTFSQQDNLISTKFQTYWLHTSKHQHSPKLHLLGMLLNLYFHHLNWILLYRIVCRLSCTHMEHHCMWRQGWNKLFHLSCSLKYSFIGLYEIA